MIKEAGAMPRTTLGSGNGRGKVDREFGLRPSSDQRKARCEKIHSRLLSSLDRLRIGFLT